MSLPSGIPFDNDDSYRFSEDRKSPKKEEHSKQISVDVNGLDGTTVQFKLRKTTALGKLMTEYCKMKHYDPTEIKFLFNDQRVLDNSTAESLGINNGDEIDTYKRQDGGNKN